MSGGIPCQSGANLGGLTWDGRLKCEAPCIVMFSVAVYFTLSLTDNRSVDVLSLPSCN